MHAVSSLSRTIPVTTPQTFQAKQLQFNYASTDSAYFGSKKAKEDKILRKKEIMEELRRNGNHNTFHAAHEILERMNEPNVFHVVSGLIADTVSEAFFHQDVPVQGSDLSVIRQNYKDLLATTNLDPRSLNAALGKLKQQFKSLKPETNNSNDLIQNFIDFANERFISTVGDFLGSNSSVYIDDERKTQNAEATKELPETAGISESDHINNSKRAAETEEKEGNWFTKLLKPAIPFLQKIRNFTANPWLIGALIIGGIPFAFIPTFIGLGLIGVNILTSFILPKPASDETVTNDTNNDGKSKSLFNYLGQVFKGDQKDTEDLMKVMSGYIAKYPQPETRTRGNLMKYIVDEACELPADQCPKALNQAANSILYFKKLLDDVKPQKGISSPEEFKDVLEQNLKPLLNNKQINAIENLIDEYERKIGTHNAEAAREHLQTVFDMPWGKYNPLNTTLKPSDIQKIFDATHQGMPKVKEFFIKYIGFQQSRVEAERALNAQQASGKQPTAKEQQAIDLILGEVKKAKANKASKFRPILFVGPPGVGKTSVLENVAAAMGTTLSTISLAGETDPNRIKGTSRTYVGAEAGMLIDAIKEAGTMNPLVAWDEIDKVAPGFKGDPNAPLLKILDPQQNKHFIDDNFKIPLDLSDIPQIATANSLKDIPEAIRSRFQIIQFPGYTLQQQVDIGLKMVAEKTEKVGLSVTSLQTPSDKYDAPILDTSITNHPLVKQLDKKLLTTLISRYPGGSGVRELEQNIDQVLASWVHAVNIEREKTGTPLKANQLPTVTSDNLDTYLTEAKMVPMKIYTPEELEEERVGQIRGMYYSSGVRSGGSTEYTIAIPNGSVRKPVGQESSGIEVIPHYKHGEMMADSAKEIAYFITNNIEKFNTVNPSFVKCYENGYRIPIQIHQDSFYSGVDGPSATTAFTLAIISKLTGYKVPVNLAITGSMTHQGKEGIIGGVMEKIIGSYNEGITNFYVPPDNYEEVVKELKYHPEVAEAITVKPFNHIYDIMNELWVGKKGPEGAKEFVDQFKPELMTKTEKAKFPSNKSAS